MTEPPPRPAPGHLTRLALRGLGAVCVALAFAGVAIPGMPTTVFLILALWAFARSSPRLHGWLLNHRRFGPGLRAWEAHGAIPRSVKVLAVGSLVASFVFLVFFFHSPLGLGLTAAIFLLVAAFIVSRPEGPLGGSDS
jgi:uncharacterized membrane protein YbaN (DUF454 family)